MILHAIAEGETDPVRLASFAVGRVRASKEELEAALTGQVTAHHRFMLTAHLKQISWFDSAIEQVNAEIARRLNPPEPPSEEQVEQQGNVEASERGGDESEPEPVPGTLAASTGMAPAAVEGEPPLSWQEAVRLVDQITGISEQVAWGVLAEIGIEMSQFPSEKHLARLQLACARATMKVRGNATPAKPAKAIPTLVASSFRPLLPQPKARRAICRRSIAASRLDGGRRKRRSPSRTVFW